MKNAHYSFSTGKAVSKIKKIKQRFFYETKRFGMPRAILSLFYGAIFKIIPFYLEYVYVNHLDVAKNIVPPCTPEGITLHWATEADIELIAEMPNCADIGALAAGRCAAGDKCLMLCNNSSTLGFVWFGNDISRFCPCLILKQGSVYAYDLYIHPLMRGKRLNRIIRFYMNSALYAEGSRYLIAIIDWRNWASQRAEARIGFKPVGWTLTLGGNLLSADAPRFFSRLLKNSPGISILKNISAEQELRNGDEITSATIHHSFRPSLPDLKL